MAMKPSLGLRQTQRLALTPDMRRSLELLRMPAAGLAAEIAREQADNPYLRVSWPRGGAGAGGGAFDVALDTVAARPSLVDEVRAQIALMRLPAPVAALAAYLAGDLREDGYLDGDPQEAAALAGLGPDAAAAALQALQSCEPAGVGARSLRECLALQLADRGVASGQAAALLDRLDLVSGGDTAALARALDVVRPEAARLVGIVHGLRALPVDAGATDARPLRADLTVWRGDDGGLRVDLATGAAPVLALDTALLAESGASGFAAARKARAEALIAAVSARAATLARIGADLIATQYRFFAGGVEDLRPDTRRAMAARLGLHPTTVGRAVAGKALDHGGRLHPLETFFSPALGRAEDTPISAFAARQALARIVAAEPPDAPLPDAALCARLRAEGVDISRRTVAKYRGCMRIPSSHGRRRRKRARGMQPRPPGNGGPSTS